MKIAVGSDHGGYPLKQVVVDELLVSGHAVVDCGAQSYDADDDYPDFAKAVGLALQRGDAERGIVLCGSGVGACVAGQSATDGTRAGGLRSVIMALNPLFELQQHGQSVWFDSIGRSLITSGGLQELINRYAVVGVTSNPTIFDRAVSGSADYDEDIRALARGGLSAPRSSRSWRRMISAWPAT